MKNLTEEEQEIKAELEAVISDRVKAFLELMTALAEYKELKLWRIEYDSFEACCKGKWNIGRSRAQQLIAGGKTLKALEEAAVKPENESQVRPLSKGHISDKDKQEIWEGEVNRSAIDGKPITQESVTAAIDSREVGLGSTAEAVEHQKQTQLEISLLEFVDNSCTLMKQAGSISSDPGPGVLALFDDLATRLPQLSSLLDRLYVKYS